MLVKADADGRLDGCFGCSWMSSSAAEGAERREV